MKKPNGRETKAILVLALIIPIGLLTTLKLTGILQAPVTIAETKTLEVVEWESERTSSLFHFSDRVEAGYIDDISVNQTVGLWGFDGVDKMYDCASTLRMNLNLTASLLEGHIENVNVTFYDNDLSSQLRILYLPLGSETQTAGLGSTWKNLSITDYEDWMQWTGALAFVNFEGVNNPSKVYFNISLVWVMRSPLNQSEQLTIRTELTYFNGTTHTKLVQPFRVRLIHDMNEDFETAQEVVSGQVVRSFLGGEDKQDFYKIWLGDGNTISASMTARTDVNFDLYLYNPNQIEVSSSTNGPGITESISYTVDAAGFWFIEVRNNGGQGVYTLTLTITP